MTGTAREFDPYARPADPAGDSPAVPPPNSGYAQLNCPGVPGSWPQAPPPKGLALASLVCGTSGVMLSWVTFGIPSILAVIFGHIALYKANQGTGGGRELAIAGLVTGYIIVGIFLLILTIVSLMSFAAA